MRLLTVHLRINDAATRLPTPVRLRITGPGGEYFPPLGRPADVPVGRGEAVGGSLRFGAERWAFIDGSCEVRLPAQVPLTVEALKGPEYVPLRHPVTLGAGQMTLRLALRRWADLRAQGWYSGDTRCHFLSPHDALFEAEAEDVAVANLLAAVLAVPSRDGHAYPCVPNILAFSGQKPALERGGHLVAVNTHNTHPALGKLGLLHTHRPVYPLTFGGDDTDDWSLAEWCEQCHRKRGLVVWTDAFRPAGLVGGEALVNLILGRVDAIEADAHERAAPLFPFWYRLLSAGLRVPLAGGSGKDSNRTALGGVRTYARLAEAAWLSCGEWVEAVRHGRTFVTNGPLLGFEVNGREPGTVLEWSAESGPLRVRAAASSVVPFEELEVIANGEVIARAPASTGEIPDLTPLPPFPAREGGKEPFSPPPRFGERDEGRGFWTARVEVEHALPDGGWLAARCRGAQRSPFQPTLPVLAHTSAVYVQVSGRPPFRDEQALRALRPMVEQTRDWVQREGRFADERNREHLLADCDAALARL